MARKPNILVLVNDHQAYYRHGWEDGVRPQTPNFDRLAAGGIRFERSYAAVPLCGPSRRTLVTGLYPHKHHNYYNYTNSAYDHAVYLQTLAENGYRCSYFGKWHAGPGTAHDFGCDGFCYSDYGNPYRTPEYHAYLQEHGLPPAEHYVETVFRSDVTQREFPRLQEGIVYRCDNHWCGEHASGLTLTPKETHESFFLAHLACEQLAAYARSAAQDERPFHLRVDFWGPHQPYFPTPEFAALYDPQEILEYGSFRDPLQGKPDYYWLEYHHRLADGNGRAAVPSPLSWPEWQKVVARAYGHITMIDAAGGLILDKLEELGLAENTLVLWTADHGDALGSHGGRFDKGSYLTEEIIRVPLAVRLPGVIPAAQESRELVSGVDVVPTLLDAGGIEPGAEMDGRSLLPLASGSAAQWRDSLMVETYGHGFGQIDIGRAIIKGRYKYVNYQNHTGELYDLEADPYELNNLITDPAYEKIVDEMDDELRQWLRRTGDDDFEAPVTEQFVAADRRQFQQLLERRAAFRRGVRA